MTMRDDYEFNIEFCDEIHIHPNLYDHMRADYCNRSVQDQTWQKIAQKFAVNVTECKERWKNIRGSYSKYKGKLQTKSGQRAKQVKEYYLATHLLFLDPFLKSRKSKGNMVDQVGEGADDVTSVEENTEPIEDDDYSYIDEVLTPDKSELMRSSFRIPLRSSNTSLEIEPINIRAAEAPPETKTTCYRKKKKLNSHHHFHQLCQQASLSVFRKKKQQILEMKNTTMTTDTPDSDLAFFQSVLPDMKLMNSVQKRRFKMGILNLVEQILSTTFEVPTPIGVYLAEPPLNKDSRFSPEHEFNEIIQYDPN